MASQNIATIILAAGKGTRMNSSLHKVLHPVARLPMIDHVLKSSAALNPKKQVVIVGAEREQLTRHLPDVDFAVQDPQLGTGHAVQQAESQLKDFDGAVLILYGDVPLIQPETLQRMVTQISSNDRCAMVVLGFYAKDPMQYGRIISEQSGTLSAIVEYKDADEATRAIDLCNSGIMAVRGSLLFSMLNDIQNDNASNEYYLTDLVTIARSQNHTVGLEIVEEDEVGGVNTFHDLAVMEGLYQSRARNKLMSAGVYLENPDTVYLAHDTKIEKGVTIGPSVVFGEKVSIASGAHIHAFSHLEGCTIAANSSIGPYARLRPGADIGEDCKIGNFVEVKKSTLQKGSKVSHLSYIGDSELGAGVNIGAGTITCNYDGYNKFKTQIGDGAFIGSNTSLVAPVSIGAGAIVGAGSVITKTVSEDDLAITRANQKAHSGWAKGFREKQKK